MFILVSNVAEGMFNILLADTFLSLSFLQFRPASRHEWGEIMS